MTLRNRYLQDFVSNVQHRRTDFTLSIFREDYIRIGDLVCKIPHAETGGNLFGLWTNQSNAVVLVATGPGKDCKRTSASFYQDIPYMKRVGDLLTTKYPLCHMGEWHSHHQMQLFQPSFGDCNTVQRNYPRGSQGFILMIANILRDGTVRLSPYKFTDDHSSYKLGKIEVISAENPFMKVGDITRAIDNGKEHRILLQQLSGGVTVGECQGTKYPSYSKDDNQNRARRGGSWSRGRSRSRSPIKKNHDDLSADEEERETRRPRRQQETPTPKRAVPSYRSSDQPFGQENYLAQDYTTQWYETETEIMKRIMRYVTSLADEPRTVKVSRDKTTLNITITFTHHDFDWSIQFPYDFPKGSARLQKKYSTYSWSVRGQGNIDSFKNALESMLQEQCATCMRVVSSKVASPSRQGRLEGHSQQGETQVGQWYDIQPSILRRTIDIVTSLADGKAGPDISRDKSTNDITLEFKHHGGKWAVEFPPNFPTGNVKLKTKVNGSTNNSYGYSASFSYTNASPLSCIVKACGDVNIFKEKLQSALRQYCVKCSRYAQSNRFTRNKLYVF